MTCVLLSLLLIVATAFTQSLTDLLKSKTELSVWYRLIQPQWETLNSLKNITFFAPNNDAMLAYFNTAQISGCASTNTNILQALISYHTLQQAYYSFPGSSFFYTELAGTEWSGSVTNQTYLQTPNPSNISQGGSVYSDQNVLVSGLNAYSNLLSAPISFSNGVVYVIDAVLQLPANTSATLIAAGYTAFLGALRHTNTEDIANTRGIDLNVPTNEAFQDVGEILQKLSPDEARAMMLYHMSNDSFYASSGYPEGTQPTLEGTNITVTNASTSPSYDNNALIDDSAYFFSSDSNNIWVIKQVLNPQNTTAPLNSSSWPNPSKVSYIPFASLVPYTPVPLCQKPAWLDSVIRGDSKKVSAGAIAGGVVGGVLGLCMVAFGIFSMIRRRNRYGHHLLNQEIDGTETIGKPELTGSTQIPIETGPEQKHELDTKQKFELSTEPKEVFELPSGDNRDKDEIEAPFSPAIEKEKVDFEPPASWAELVSPLSPHTGHTAL